MAKKTAHKKMGALALRKIGKIGVLWAEGGQYWISESEFDPHGTRLRLSLGEMAELVESLEARYVRFDHETNRLRE